VEGVRRTPWQGVRSRCRFAFRHLRTGAGRGLGRALELIGGPVTGLIGGRALELIGGRVTGLIGGRAAGLIGGLAQQLIGGHGTGPVGGRAIGLIRSRGAAGARHGLEGGRL
jgi:hypothetical protein